MAQIEQFVAPAAGFHTQQLDAQTGTQASGKDFYAINQTFSQNGAINFDPLVKGLGHAAYVLENKVESDAKIWAYDIAAQGEFEFKKKLAAGVDPSSLSNDFQAWQSKMAASAPSGLANSLFLRNTDEMGRSMVLAGIRQANAIDTANKTEKINNYYNENKDKILAMSPSDVHDAVKLVDTDLAHKAVSSGSVEPIGIAGAIASSGTTSKTSKSNARSESTFGNFILNEMANTKPEEVLKSIESGSLNYLKPQTLETLKHNATKNYFKNSLQGATPLEIKNAELGLSALNLDPKEMSQIKEYKAQLNSMMTKDSASYFSSDKVGMQLQKNIELSQISSDEKDPMRIANFQKANEDLVNHIKSRSEQSISILSPADRSVIPLSVKNDYRNKLQSAIESGSLVNVASGVESLKKKYGNTFNDVWNDIALDKKTGNYSIPFEAVVASDIIGTPGESIFKRSLTQENKIASKEYQPIKKDSMAFWASSESGKALMVNQDQMSMGLKIQQATENLAAQISMEKKVDAPTALAEAEKIMIDSSYQKVKTNGQLTLWPKKYGDVSNEIIQKMNGSINQITKDFAFATPENLKSEWGDRITADEIASSAFWMPSSGGKMVLTMKNGSFIFPVPDKDGNAIVKTLGDFNEYQAQKGFIESMLPSSAKDGMGLRLKAK